MDPNSILNLWRLYKRIWLHLDILTAFLFLVKYIKTLFKSNENTELIYKNLLIFTHKILPCSICGLNLIISLLLLKREFIFWFPDHELYHDIRNNDLLTYYPSEKNESVIHHTDTLSLGTWLDLLGQGLWFGLNNCQAPRQVQSRQILNLWQSSNFLLFPFLNWSKKRKENVFNKSALNEILMTRSIIFFHFHAQLWL